MPQFVKDGPDIPVRLLQAHEEGRVVFFCGAGISIPAGLPSFKELVCKLYEKPSRTPSPIEETAFNKESYETVIELLEDRLHEGRTVIRRDLTNLLQPSPVNANATALHRAVLSLARQRNGKLRLVTTNIDRVFEEVTASQTCPVGIHRPPSLPKPNEEWDGLIYLHGLLPEISDAECVKQAAWNQLVISSGDFGRAYLKERRAAWFVSELFQN